MRSKIAKVIGNHTGLHHVRLIEKLNTGVCHNPPLVAKEWQLPEIIQITL